MWHDLDGEKQRDKANKKGLSKTQAQLYASYENYAW